MYKTEAIWRGLLYRAIEQHQNQFRLNELAKEFQLSTSMVSHALLPLRELGIVNIGKVSSQMRDAERLLFFWATRRNLKQDIIYQTASGLPPLETEASLPAEVIATAYSAYRLYVGEPKTPLPADYDHVYFYAKNLEPIKSRFPPFPKKPANLFILKPDLFLDRYPRIPLAQIFSDLWNLPEWYAKEFQDSLLEKIRAEIGL